MLTFGVTDIQHEDVQRNYRAVRIEIGAYISVGNKFMDVVVLSDKDSKVQIPLSNPRENIQVIIKNMDRNEKKLGSLSIPVEKFLELPQNASYSHWVTLFDYLEDDEYDGDLGVDDEENPRVWVTYQIDSQSPTTTSKTVTSTEESKGGSKRVFTTTRTTTSTVTKQSPDRISKIYKPEQAYASEPQPETLNVKAAKIVSINESVSQSKDSAERYSVKVLRGDLTANTEELKGELRDQQAYLFNEEDNRANTLGHLESLHRELQGEHVQDQMEGFKLARKDEEITCDYDIRKAAFGEQKDVLKSKIDVVQSAYNQALAEKDKEAKENKRVGAEVAKPQDIKASGLTPLAKELRAEDDDLRKNIKSSNINLDNDRNDTNKLMRQHEDVITAYNNTIDRYNELLSKVEKARADAVNEWDVAKANISHEDGVNTELRYALSNSNYDSSSLSDAAKLLKSQLLSLTDKYKAFIKMLSEQSQAYNTEIEKVKGQINSNANDWEKLSNDLKKKGETIEQLHEEVDKQKAVALNERLSRLIDTLVTVDSKRRTSQDSLENGQTNWSIKLKLFLDEASKRSRESARLKRIQEIEQKITKIDRLTREIYDIRTQIDKLENKVFTDKNRDTVTTEFKYELDGHQFKLRWAEDQRRQAFEELEYLLQLLKDRDIRDSQRSEITDLLDELENLKRQLEQNKQMIRELVDEIGELDDRIAELQQLIDEKNKEIDELTRELNTRLARIRDLEKALGKASKSSYKAAQGDLVDQMLAEFLNIAGWRVPVKRLGGGFYLFGTRKIYAKIMNGKLVVRVGGGYMVIDEFIATYSDPEIIKLEKLCEREGVSSYYDLDLEAIAGVTAEKSPLGRSPGRSSPKGTSFRGAALGSSINGTTRSPRLNAAAIQKARRLE